MDVLSILDIEFFCVRQIGVVAKSEAKQICALSCFCYRNIAVQYIFIGLKE